MVLAERFAPGGWSCYGSLEAEAVRRQSSCCWKARQLLVAAIAV